MNPTNLEALKQLLKRALGYLASESKVVRHSNGQTLWLDTFVARTRMWMFHAALDRAETIEEVGALIAEVRAYTVEKNCYPPRTYLGEYERIIATGFLHQHGLLGSVEWWRDASLRRLP